MSDSTSNTTCNKVPSVQGDKITIPRNQKAEAKARNNLIMGIVGAFCEMDDHQRKTLVDTLRDKQANFKASDAEVAEGFKKLSLAGKNDLIRFAKALANDDVAELKAIKASSENWPESLDSSITDIEQGKNHQQDLSIPAGIPLGEKLELLLKHLEVLRAAEINAVLGLVEMSGVKL